MLSEDDGCLAVIVCVTVPILKDKINEHSK